MQKYAVVSLVAAAFLASNFAATASETTAKKHAVKHQVVADRDQDQGRYGLPANYYPAPPFPFFLLPGPWWLPAHP